VSSLRDLDIWKAIGNTMRFFLQSPMPHPQCSSWLSSAHALVASIFHTLSSAMVRSFRHVDDTERRLVRNMAKERIPWVTIQRITGRSPDTIRSMLNPAATIKRKGAPIKFGPKDVDKVLKVAEKMQKNADGQKEISLEMIQRAAGVKLSPTTVRKAFKERGVGFFKLKEKPLLEEQDVKDRRKWAEAHQRRTEAQWITKPHAIIDNKSFQITANRKSREFLARRSVRGAYQKKGTGPKKWLVKPKSGTNKAKFPSVQVTAAVIKGKIRVWNYVEGNCAALVAVKFVVPGWWSGPVDGGRAETNSNCHVQRCTVTAGLFLASRLKPIIVILGANTHGETTP
jgi:hypothetical protein